VSTVISSFATISCDGECGKTITFPQTKEGEQEALQSTPWLNAIRFVNTPDGRKFVYCNDECEIKAAGAGNHNQKVVVQATAPNSVDLAAQAAARAAQATQALKVGGPVTLS
jgi:hypothetical protein